MFEAKHISGIIDFTGSLVVVLFCIHALSKLILSKFELDKTMRQILARGATFGLTFKSAAALLNVIELRSWNEIFVFAAIVSLRTLLKLEFQWQGKVDSGLPLGEQS